MKVIAPPALGVKEPAALALRKKEASAVPTAPPSKSATSTNSEGLLRSGFCEDAKSGEAKRLYNSGRTRTKMMGRAVGGAICRWAGLNATHFRWWCGTRLETV